MGLFKSTKNAIGSTLKDQWKDLIDCEDMSNDILMVKKTTETGVISNKSAIIVSPGQCAVILDNGKVVDATAEEGIYTYDEMSSPSFFAGQFGDVFKEMWQRFTYGGATAKRQEVYFLNIKEIIDNKFGTPNPIPFQDWSHPIQNRMTNTVTPMRVKIKCFGTFTFKMNNPALFLQEIAGTADLYKKSQLADQLRSEVLATFQNVINELGTSVYKVPVLEMPSQTDEIKEMMDKKVFDEPMRKRGLSILGFAVESVTLDDESEKKIDQYEIGINQYMQQGTMVSSYGNAMEKAAENANGATTGFMGLGMMNQMQTGNGIAGSVFSQNTESSQIKEEPLEENKNEAKTAETSSSNTETWTCECGQQNKLNFCLKCGKKKPNKEKTLFCPNCGNKVPSGSKFCGECGTKIQ